MFAGQRRSREGLNIWPGFVDALATVLLAFIFVILLFVVSQFYLSDVLSNRNVALARLQEQVDELARTLSNERDERDTLEEQITEVYSKLHASLSERDALRQSLGVTQKKARELRNKLDEADRRAEVSKEMLTMRLRELASLQADIAALREVRNDLEDRVGKLSSKLSDVEGQLGQARDRSKALRAKLADTKERTNLQQEKIAKRETRIATLVAQIDERTKALDEQQQLTADARAKVESLRRELKALRDQLATVATALDASKQTVADQQQTINDLGKKLNTALAERVQRLSGYRSEFFGRLREALGDVDQIRVVGDRFVFQSELFFESSKAALGDEGRQKLDQLAKVLNRVTKRIPRDVDWVLQVEGHTDRRPINTPRFPSNWELSTARATNIVKYLISQGIDPDRLAAAGYGKYQPVDEADTADAYAANRRIEFKLTNQ